MTIHREGKGTISVVLIFSILILLTAWRFGAGDVILSLLGVGTLILLSLVLQFFRYPQRTVASVPDNFVLAPADGKVVVIEDTIETEYFEDERLLISIFMSPLNVHSNHHPIDGQISYERYHPGKYLVAWHPKSSTENERHTTVYASTNGPILIRQIAGAVARRIVNYTKVGDSASRGGEMGFIKFGSRVDIYLPVGTKHKVKLGQTVKSRIDVIAEL
ncbi:MAG: phosphatidylserine decarboxylase family protein [Bacteroidota bacterium]